MSSPLLSSCLLMVAFNVPLKELTDKSEPISLTQRSYKHREGLSLSDAGLTRAIGGYHEVWQNETEALPDFVVGELGVATTAIPEQYGGWVKFRDGLLSLLTRQLQAADAETTVRCVLRYIDLATVETAHDIQSSFRWPIEPLIALPSPTSEITVKRRWAPGTPDVVIQQVAALSLRVNRKLQQEFLSPSESRFHGIMTLDVEADFPMADERESRMERLSTQLDALHLNSKRLLWHLVSDALRSNTELFDDDERAAFQQETTL